MFKLNRHRSDRFWEKVEFKLSNLQAIKVPKGWDKLIISIVSVESGRTIAKTSKATVRSGNCQWTEIESIWVSQDEATKELEECQFKIIVSPASSKSSIIGEVTLNLGDYLNAAETGPLFLPLSKCDSGTTLQAKIQCCNPKSKFRGGKSWRETVAHLDDQNNNDELDKSDESDNINRNIGSSSNCLGYTYPDESGNRVAGFSASGSQRCADSGDSSGWSNSPPKNSLNGEQHIGTIDSFGRRDQSDTSSFSSGASGSSVRNSQDMTAQPSENGTMVPSLRSCDSSKELLEAVEEIEELRDEVKMWERHSRQLKLDLATLKKENSEKSKQQAELDKQLSVSYSEHESLKLEVEQLKTALEETMPKQKGFSSRENEDMSLVRKDELKFLKDSNAELTEQLRKTQDSNIELVSILQEMEEITEKQKFEADNLLHQSRLDEHDGQGRCQNSLDNKAVGEREMLSSGNKSDLVREVESLKNKVLELEKGCSELTEENLNLLYKLKELSKDSEKRDLSHASREFHEQISSNNSDSENGLLKSQILELVEYELKRKEVTTAALSDKFKDLEKASAGLEIELQHYKEEASDLERKLDQMHQELEEKNIELADLQQKLELSLGTDMDGFDVSSMKRSTNVAFNDAEKAAKKTKIEENIGDGFQATLLLKEQEIDTLKCSIKELDDLFSNLQKEKDKLEEDFISLHGQNREMSKILEDVEKDLEEVTGSMEFYISTNRILEKKSVELEGCKNELELHVSQLEQENIQFSERICGLEAQLRHLTNENETNRLELENTRLLVAVLKDEIEQQKGEIEMQKEELKEKLQEAQKRLSEVLEESNLSRRSNLKLQATNENLIEECNSLQKLTGNLKSQKMELHEQVAHLEVELSESKKKNFDFSEQVDLLELKLASLQKVITSKEKSLLSQLERIFQEHKQHEERIEMAQTVLNKIELEKAVEVENLQREIANFTSQMSSSQDEREKLALDAVHEASVLRSEKAWLECSLQESNSKAKLYGTDLQTLQIESKDKIQGLVDLLNASKQSEEMLVADIEHMKRVMEGVKSSEEKHRKMATDSELKHKASDYKIQQLVEEMSGLKTQLQKLSHIQDSVLDLKSSLDEAKCEKQKLEEELKLVAEEHNVLKSEKESMTEKLLNMQKALSVGEDHRRSKIVLQEKLLRLESDLSIKEASSAYEAELKNEINRIKRTNSEYQRKVQNLELENVELVEKMQTLEIELMVRKTTKGENSSECGKNEILRTEHHTETTEENNVCKEQFTGVFSGEQAGDPAVLNKILTDNSDKISSLETELKDVKERYLHMSLQYAEVEAEREGLVMQLKSAKKEKRWFS